MVNTATLKAIFCSSLQWLSTMNNNFCARIIYAKFISIKFIKIMTLFLRLINYFTEISYRNTLRLVFMGFNNPSLKPCPCYEVLGLIFCTVNWRNYFFFLNKYKQFCYHGNQHYFLNDIGFNSNKKKIAKKL